MKEGRRKLILGIVIGVILAVVLFLVWLAIFGDERIIFVNENAYQKTKEEFAGGDIPVYDEAYCKTRFFEIYGAEGEAERCLIKSVGTFTRENTIVKDVECICWR